MIDNNLISKKWQQVSDYTSGKMSDNERLIFEHKANNSDELKEMIVFAEYESLLPVYKRLVRNELNDVEKKQFLQKIANYPRLKEEFLLEKTLEKHLVGNPSIDDTEENSSGEFSLFNHFNQSLGRIIVSLMMILLLCGGSYYFTYNYYPFSSGKEIPAVVISISPKEGSLLSKGVIKYKNGAYLEAAGYFEAVIQDLIARGSDDLKYHNKLRLYLAICHLKTGTWINFNKATSILLELEQEQIFEKSNSKSSKISKEILDYINFYLGLTNMHKDNFKEAKTYLQKVEKNQSIFEDRKGEKISDVVKSYLG